MEKADFDSKVKDNEIENLKANINCLKLNIKKIMKENNDYIKNNSILGTQMKEKENEKKKLEKYYKEHIKMLEKNISNLEVIINNKSKMIEELKERINDYSNEISIKEIQINA